MDQTPKTSWLGRFGWWLAKSLFWFVVVNAVVGLLVWKFILPHPKYETKIFIDSGIAQKQTGNTWLSLVNLDILKNNDVVKTGPNSEATISFPSGSELRLDENTQITVTVQSKDKVSIFQSLGRTWSRVVKLTGSQKYEVETPNAVATVRGTDFATTLDDIFTDTGSVGVTDKKTGQKMVVEAGFSTKGKIPDDVRNGAWFKKNREKKLRRTLDDNNLSLDDVRKIQGLFERVKSGKLDLTDDQKQKLMPIAQKLQSRGGQLDVSMAPDIAQALAIIDPDSFSNVEYWAELLARAIPLISKFQLMNNRQ